MGAEITGVDQIIVIDDDPALRRACEAALKRAGYPVETFSDGPSGLARIGEVNPALIIVDLKMPGMDGMEVIQRAKESNPDTVSIVITGFATVTTAVEAMKAGAFDFLPKPFTAEELRVIIARGLKHRHLLLETRRLRQEKETQARKFITFVSHQLKSPLGAVQQYLDVLRYQADGGGRGAARGLEPQQRQWIDRSSDKIAGMLQVIRDWLTISKVEGGQLATDRVPVRWQELAVDVVETAAASDNRQVKVINELPADLPAVIGDATALRMLLANLVNNAVKYNYPDGEVRLTATADDAGVTVSVSDTGPGISEENQQHVFEEFFRVVGEGTAGKSGTGMGLAICRKIAEELGGSITLTSELGKGSTFTVVLPRAQTDEPGTAAEGQDAKPRE